MRGITEEGGAAGHGPQDAAIALHAEILGDPAAPGHEACQRLGLVSVELIMHDDPSGFGIGFDHSLDVGGAVGRGSRRAHGGGGEIARGHLQPMRHCVP